MIQKLQFKDIVLGIGSAMIFYMIFLFSVLLFGI